MNHKEKCQKNAQKSAFLENFEKCTKTWKMKKNTQTTFSLCIQLGITPRANCALPEAQFSLRLSGGWGVIGQHGGVWVWGGEGRRDPNGGAPAAIAPRGTRAGQSTANATPKRSLATLEETKHNVLLLLAKL